MRGHALVLCVAGLCLASADLHPDIRAVVNVTGRNPGSGWADSYSVGNECFCATKFDHNIGPFVVETELGWLTVQEVCELLGPGPGKDGNPIYNDVQCGNGPPNDSRDELQCPGRTDIGLGGCGQIGPKWNFAHINVTNMSPTASPKIPGGGVHPDIRWIINVTGDPSPGTQGWASSYSVGNDCYCSSGLDGDTGNFPVDTDLGWMKVAEICEVLGPGPGIDGNPVYNDVQCGNGPPSRTGDEHRCPGRTDIGPDGCGQIGPKWNLVAITGAPSTPPTKTTSKPVETGVPTAEMPTATPEETSSQSEARTSVGASYKNNWASTWMSCCLVFVSLRATT